MRHSEVGSRLPNSEENTSQSGGERPDAFSLLANHIAEGFKVEQSVRTGTSDKSPSNRSFRIVFLSAIIL